MAFTIELSHETGRTIPQNVNYKMKVFISWSGELSLQVAASFKGWLECVLQATEPWMSTKIDRGSMWFPKITSQLKDTNTGVICLTRDNLKSPWLLFEAGAIAKGQESNKVCTLLIGLKPTDVQDPLAQFNHTSAESKESMFKLIQTLNSQLQKPLELQTLKKTFEANWPEFETSYSQIVKSTNLEQQAIPERSTESLLVEILENTRSISQRVRYLEEHDTQFQLDRMDEALQDKNKIRNTPIYTRPILSERDVVDFLLRPQA